MLSRRTPPPSRRRLAVAVSNGLVVGGAIGNRHRAESIRARVGTVDVELAREQSLQRIVIELERVPQIDQWASGDADPGVDLFAVVTPRVAD